MATGCDFICENKDCKHYKTGVVILAAWPLGDIDQVINSANVKKNQPFRSDLIKLKKEGRVHACINFPNAEEIPVHGYRVNLWCSKCPAIWTYDALLTEENNDMEKAIQSANIPDNCPTCQTKLQSLKELLEDNAEGVICTGCKQKTVPNAWFANEKEEK